VSPIAAGEPAAGWGWRSVSEMRLGPWDKLAVFWLGALATIEERLMDVWADAERGRVPLLD
jgi:hypothetical protein